MKLSIIIVNYNVKHFLEQCLYSVYEAQKECDKLFGKNSTEVFVVDNASQDDSCEMIKNTFPEVKLIENKKNVGFSTANNTKVIPIVSSIDDGFALPEIEEFEKLITSKTKAILICNPGNPTGYLYSKEEIEKLKVLVLKHDLFLIADEVYREFVYDGNQHNSVMNLKDLDQHAIMIDSVSKRYSMCGARIGCIVSRNKELIQTTLKFAQARLSPPTYALIASEAALETPQSYFDEVIKEYVARRDVLISELNKIPNLKVSKPKGAFYCIVELPVTDADNFAQWMLEKFEDNKETIMVAPASGFYSTAGSGKNQIRIAYVLNKESLIRSVELLKLALEQYKN